MKKFLLIPFIIFLVVLLVGPIIMVQADGGGKIIEIENPLKYDTIEEIIKALTGILKVVAIGVGVIMVIIGGIQIMTGMMTGEKENKVNKGKKTIMWALIGVAIVISVDFIVGFVQEILAD